MFGILGVLSKVILGISLWILRTIEDHSGDSLKSLEDNPIKDLLRILEKVPLPQN